MMKKLLYSIGVAMAMWILASCSHEVKIAVRSEEPSPLMEEYADIIIPQGGHNKVAIDVISATIEKSLSNSKKKK